MPTTTGTITNIKLSSFLTGTVELFRYLRGHATGGRHRSVVVVGACPESGLFDGITDPMNRTLYVELEGRSVLRLSGVSAPPPLTPPDFSLLDLASILSEA